MIRFGRISSIENGGDAVRVIMEPGQKVSTLLAVPDGVTVTADDIGRRCCCAFSGPGIDGMMLAIFRGV